MRYFKFKAKLNILFIIAITVFYNEYLTYYIKQFSWHKIECDSTNKLHCLKILLVADPQILGEISEDYIIRLDSDRFLSKTYTLAVSYFKPNVIIFLGDLMNEGSIATDEEFQRYIYRLFHIFNTQYPIQHIWIPGDNDIGGDEDRVTKEKVNRYENTIQQPSILSYENVMFFKVNRLTYIVPKNPYNESPTSNINIALSHLPLLFMPATYVDQVIDVIRPSLIFSAHLHKSMVVDTDYKQNDRHINVISESVNSFYEVNLTENKIYEFIVPASSYRLGTQEVGFGAVALDMKTKHFKYTILWSPVRFFHLSLYLCILAGILVYLLYRFARYFIRPNKYKNIV